MCTQHPRKTTGNDIGDGAVRNTGGGVRNTGGGAVKEKEQDMATSNEQWFFDPTTGEVTEGKVTGWKNRMGPYDSKELAENAFEIAKKRNDAADQAEDEDDDWGQPADWEK